MTSSTRITNRATRLRLGERLALAHHAKELLRNKEEALRRERTRLTGHTVRTGQRWQAALQEAGTWLARVRALGSAGELDRTLGERDRLATIDVIDRMAMGVSYPDVRSCDPGVLADLQGTAALVPARAAFQEAVRIAAEHAAATAALERLDAELSGTRRRRRAIEQKLEPQLVAELHQLDLDLDERERDAAVRSQLARHLRRGATR